MHVTLLFVICLSGTLWLKVVKLEVVKDSLSSVQVIPKRYESPTQFGNTNVTSTLQQINQDNVMNVMTADISELANHKTQPLVDSDDVRSLENQLQYAEYKIKILSNSVGHLEESVETLKVKLKSQETENLDLIREVTLMQETYEEKEHVLLNEKSNCVGEKKKLASKLKSQKNIIKRLRSELDELKAEDQEKILYINKLLSNYDIQWERCQRLRQQIDRLSADRFRLNNTVAMLSSQLIAFQEKSMYLNLENFYLKTAVIKQNRNVARLKSEKLEILRPNATLLAHILGEDLLTSVQLTMKAEINETNKTRNSSTTWKDLNLQSNASNIYDRLVKCAAHLSALDNEYVLLESDNFKLKKENTKLQSKLEELVSINALLHSQTTSAFEEITLLQNNSEILTKKLMLSEEQINKLQTSNYKISKINWDLQRENEKLYTEKHNLDLQSEVQRAQIFTLQSDLTKAHQNKRAKFSKYDMETEKEYLALLAENKELKQNVKNSVLNGTL